MSDSTAQEQHALVCVLQQELRDEQSAPPEVPPGQAIPQAPSGPAPEEKLRRLRNFDARTQVLIGDSAYAELPVSPACQSEGLLWIDYLSRLDDLHDALEAKRQALEGSRDAGRN